MCKHAHGCANGQSLLHKLAGATLAGRASAGSMLGEVQQHSSKLPEGAGNSMCHTCIRPQLGGRLHPCESRAAGVHEEAWGPLPSCPSLTTTRLSGRVAAKCVHQPPVELLGLRRLRADRAMLGWPRAFSHVLQLQRPALRAPLRACMAGPSSPKGQLPGRGRTWTNPCNAADATGTNTQAGCKASRNYTMSHTIARKSQMRLLRRRIAALIGMLDLPALNPPRPTERSSPHRPVIPESAS